MICIICIFRSRGTDNFEQYIKKNHFLKSDHNITTKKNVVYKNIDHIINFLEKLPKTKHDFGSFVIDVPLANVSLNFFFIIYIFFKKTLFFQSLN